MYSHPKYPAIVKKEKRIANKKERIPKRVTKKQMKYINFLHPKLPVQVQTALTISRSTKKIVAAEITYKAIAAPFI